MRAVQTERGILPETMQTLAASPNRLETGETVIDVAEDRSHLVSTTEAAKHLGIAQSTLSRWVSQGLVTPTWRTPGGHMRWDLDDLEAQLDRMGDT